MIKVIGCLAIIISSSGLGYMAGLRLCMRVRELKLLIISLQILETEISYTSTPLPLAFHEVSLKSDAPVKFIFKSAYELLKKKIYPTVGEAFEKALYENKDKLSLINEDYELLKSFGFTLGNSDIENQITSFKLVIKQLEAQIIKAEEIRNKNEKMYKNLGFLAGLAVSIIFL